MDKNKTVFNANNKLDNADKISIYNNHSNHSNSLTGTRTVINAAFIAGNVTLLNSAIQINVVFFVSIISIALCILWIKILNFFKHLNSAKIDLLKKMEEEIGFDFYQQEYNLYTHKGGVSLIEFEKWIPIIFIVIYVVQFFIALIKWAAPLINLLINMYINTHMATNAVTTNMLTII
ncbi:hypothetical protein N9A04_00735 [Rickettsiales bacterium]|nr:hypothetical protein [Rickettsiales bacterium]